MGASRNEAASENINAEDVEVEVDRRTYVWDGAAWYDKRTYLAPPSETIHQLNGLLEERLIETDRHLTNPVSLVQEATRARNVGQFRRSEFLARRTLESDPRNAVAATVLSATLREMGKPDEAVEATNAFARSSAAPLLTTRAAAQCDLGLWPEALRTARHALAVSSGRAETVFAVLNRIRANAPELFP